MDLMKRSGVLMVVASALVVLGLGLASLLGASGGGGHVATAAPTTTSVTNVIVPVNGQGHRVVVPDVLGESQAQAAATLAKRLVWLDSNKCEPQ